MASSLEIRAPHLVVKIDKDFPFGFGNLPPIPLIFLHQLSSVIGQETMIRGMIDCASSSSTSPGRDQDDDGSLADMM